jgi:hypothetical protein
VKKVIIITLIALMVLAATATVASAAKPPKSDGGGKKIKPEHGENACTTIQSGELFASDGTVITTGYDGWGYNYQAHMFNGFYCDAYRDADWCQPYKKDSLMMKWNDAWLSNKDCDGDGLLDRHYGFDSYIGSGAWLTNHQSGEYVDEESGATCEWNYFVKIVAAPSDAYADGGYWYTADGIEIGEVIWGSFAITQQVSNDPCAGEQGLLYRSPHHAGFGGW